MLIEEREILEYFDRLKFLEQINMIRVLVKKLKRSNGELLSSEGV